MNKNELRRLALQVAQLLCPGLKRLDSLALIAGMASNKIIRKELARLEVSKGRGRPPKSVDKRNDSDRQLCALARAYESFEKAERLKAKKTKRPVPAKDIVLRQFRAAHGRDFNWLPSKNSSFRKIIQQGARALKAQRLAASHYAALRDYGMSRALGIAYPGPLMGKLIRDE